MKSETLTTQSRADRASALVVAAVLCAWLAFAGPVGAVHGEPVESEGNSGTIKIHAGLEPEAPVEPRTQPHPGCFFHIHGFHFPADVQVEWTIYSWPPTGDQTPVAGQSGSTTTDGLGEFSITPAGQPFEDGHYKAIVNTPSRPGNAPDGGKQKTFWIECEEGTAAGGAGRPGGDGGVLGGQGGQPGGVIGRHTGPGGVQGGVLGGQGGPDAGALPDTAVPAELGRSVGGLLVLLSGIGYSVLRRRNS